jgi:hypothetical protein
MRLVLALAGTIAILGVGASAPSATVADVPIVVELFTSQGCSSCPPADALVESLAKEPGIVAISRPVTYWDRLGWKDTLAREENTDLQRAYAAKGGAGAGVYTPQIMVQGRYGTVGSNQTEIRAFVRKAQQSAQAAVAVNGSVIAISGKGAGGVTLVALQSSVPVRIGRGENSSRTIRYTNVVKAERRIGRWAGGTQTFTLPAGALNVAGADRYAVIVQVPGAGPVLAGHYL